MKFDPARLAAELDFLRDNPHFQERPATIVEFVGPDYLGPGLNVRPVIMESLVAIFGDEVDPQRMTRIQEAMLTGGIGIGKTTIAAIVLSYMAHWTLCLKNPQEFFGLMPGTRISFMQMSTSAKQAKEVLFGDIKARIEHSPWFSQKYPYDDKFDNQIRFSQKDVWIVPGDSAETTFEGYNILGGILDEADSHKITATKDYADQGYTTIKSRISSRFEDRGFLMVIGQMKKSTGFAAKKYNEYLRNPDTFVRRFSIWESFGWDRYLKPDGTRDSFWYDVRRKEILPNQGIVELLDLKNRPDEFIEVPNMFRREFDLNPEKALRDLAGIPPAAGDPFISLTDKIEEATTRYIRRHGISTPYNEKGQWLDTFMGRDAIPRVGHIDMAYSAEGDALGFAMGHVQGVAETDEGQKPYIVIDCCVRLHAPPGREIFIGDVRKMIYWLKDKRRFNLKKVTTDGFESTDTRQQLKKRRIGTEKVSVDKDLTPYYDLREAIYEDRIEIPKYMVRLRHDDTALTEIVYKELVELEDMGMKVDHPPGGSKDVADAIAAVCFTLMGNRAYHRSGASAPGFIPDSGKSSSRHTSSSILSDLGASAPIPPRTDSFVWTPNKSRSPL